MLMKDGGEGADGAMGKGPRALLVHAHPEADSFVTAMRDAVRSRLEHCGWTISESDLYSMNFNPVLSGADFQARRNEEHLVFALEQRHAFETGTLATDIQSEIEKVLAADLVVFTFPIFWFSVPAILKGWIDRVFISGPFYGGRRIYGEGGLRGRKALAVFSLGGRDHMFGANSIHGELHGGMLRHFLQGTLGYVGFEVFDPFAAYHTPYVSHEERVGILANLESAIDTLDTRPALVMPRLDDFDRSFAPNR